MTHVVPTDDSDDSDSEDGFMEVECRHVKDVHIIEYLEYPQKKSLVLPNNITIYFKGNSLEARDGNFIYKYKLPFMFSYGEDPVSIVNFHRLDIDPFEQIDPTNKRLIYEIHEEHKNNVFARLYPLLPPKKLFITPVLDPTLDLSFFSRNQTYNTRQLDPTIDLSYLLRKH